MLRHPPAALFLATALAMAAPAVAQDVAWAYVNPAGQGNTFTPSLNYQYTSGGGTVTVTRDLLQQNRFFVLFPGVAPGTGVVQATSYGGNNIAVVNAWASANATDVQVTIETFTATGAAANNTPFTVHFRRGGPSLMRSAYLWADQPTAASYTPSATHAWNGTRPAPTIVRTGVGAYTVTLPQLGASVSGELGNVQVTAHSNSMLRAKVGSWLPSANGTNLEIEVRTFTAAGPADGRFLLEYHEEAAPIDPEFGSGAHVFANLPTTTDYAPPAGYADSNGTFARRGQERIHRMGTGHYRVHLPNVAPSSKSIATACTYGSGSHYATVNNWAGDGGEGTYVYVKTWTAAGTTADSAFVLNYLTDRPNREVAWAWVYPSGQGATFTPSLDYQYTPTGAPITVTRGATNNAFVVHIPDVLPNNGCVTACAYQGNHTAVVQSWGSIGNELLVTVKLYAPGGGPANDGPFVIRYERAGERNGRHAYLFANNATAASYTPATDLSWNGNRPDPTITRIATGNYVVTLPGLSPLGSEFGNMQVTPYGGSMRRAKVASWAHSGGDTRITVLVQDSTGAAADGYFTLSYNEVAAPIPDRLGSGAHMWADSPGALNYVPNAAYTDSNGTLGPQNAEDVTRYGTGDYSVHLPNLAPADASMAMVTAYGYNTAYASVRSWSTDGGNGTYVRVHTYTPLGAAVDAQFNLLYLTDRPAAGTMATNQAYGSGCNGPVLAGLTRPILHTNWNLGLTGVPGGAVLGFLQLGFTNPGLSLGAQAPGCTQYTDNLSTILLLLPIPNPCYTLAVPASSSFLGLPIRAQGGAFVPGINAFGLAASNGLLGTIGDV